MIIVAGHIRTAPELVHELVAVLRLLVPATLREQGCLSYAFGLDDAEAGTILVYERWRDEAALAAHLALPEIAEVLGTWSDRITLEVRKFDAANERDVIG